MRADWTLRGARIGSWRDAVLLARLSAHGVLPLCAGPLHARAPAQLRAGDVFCFDSAMFASDLAPPWRDSVAWEETEVDEGFRVQYHFDGLDRELRRRHLAAQAEVGGVGRTIHVVAYDYGDERPDDSLRPIDELLSCRSCASWPAPRSAYYACPRPGTLSPLIPPSSPPSPCAETLHHPETAYPTPLCSPCAAHPGRPSAADGTRQSSPQPHDRYRDLLSVAEMRDLHTAVFPSYEGCRRRIEEHKAAIREPPFAPSRADVDEQMLRRFRV